MTFIGHTLSERKTHIQISVKILYRTLGTAKKEFFQNQNPVNR